MQLTSKIAGLYWETYLGIKTRGMKPSSHEDGVYYNTVSYLALFRLFTELNFSNNDVFVDIGCGKGRIVCCAATLGIRKAIGIEIDPELAEIAQRNCEAMRQKRASTEIKVGSAESFSYKDANVLFLHNPFGEATLRKVVDRLVRENDGRSEKTIIYAFPKHRQVFDERGFKVMRTMKKDSDFVGMDVVIYAMPTLPV